jgi:hypothetical protein
LKAGKIKGNQLKASTVGRRVLSHLDGRRFRCPQIPRRTHDMRTMRGKGAGSFHTEPSRNPSY